MRRLILSSFTALAAWAFALSGCDYNDGASYRRPPNQTTQVQRGAQTDQGSLGFGGGGAAGRSGGDPGQIQHGTQKPWGADPLSAPAPIKGGASSTIGDPSGDEAVQGQGTMHPGITSDSLDVNQDRQPAVGTEDRSTSVR